MGRIVHKIMLDWLGYMGVFFASIYRIPQIIKLYRTKKGGDVSKKAFILHNAAYAAFISYLLVDRDEIDYILLSYYFVGVTQNLVIIGMKRYYKLQVEDAEQTPEEQLARQEMETRICDLVLATSS